MNESSYKMDQSGSFKEKKDNLLLRQIFFLIIIISSGIIFGRIMSVDNIPDRTIQDYRYGQIPKQLADKEKKLRAQGVGDPQIAQELKKTARELVYAAQKERPTLSANDRSRWLTLRALVEPDCRVYRFVELDLAKMKKDGSKYSSSETLRNCSCPCAQQFETNQKSKTLYLKKWVPYAIDKAMEDPRWDTIDMVKHGLKDEIYNPEDPFSGYLYSSKPTLLPTVMAAPYWILYHLFGLSLKTEPFVTVRLLLVIINLIPLMIAWMLAAQMINSLGKTDWGKIFALSFFCFGTFISAFAVTLNNHLPAVVSIVLALYGLFRILHEKDKNWYWFALTGFFGAFSVACELPALAVAAVLCAVLLTRFPKKTILISVPIGLAVAAAFVSTNYWAHGTFKPAYAQKRNHMALVRQTQTQTDIGQKAGNQAANSTSNGQKIDTENKRTSSNLKPAASGNNNSTALKANFPGQPTSLSGSGISYDRGDWYIYNYFPAGRSRDLKNARVSYWSNRIGIDRGEPSHLVYLLHTVIGHHGLFSLTPVYFLCFAGIFCSLFKRKERPVYCRYAWMVLGLTLLFFVFYLTRDQGDRNYGGMTCGLRWFFPLIPLWIPFMLPVLDRMAGSRTGRGLALILFFFSVMSVFYPVYNPWSHPWFYHLMSYWH